MLYLSLKHFPQSFLKLNFWKGFTESASFQNFIEDGLQFIFPCLIQWSQTTLWLTFLVILNSSDDCLKSYLIDLTNKFLEESLDD